MAYDGKIPITREAVFSMPLTEFKALAAHVRRRESLMRSTVAMTLACMGVGECRTFQWRSSSHLSRYRKEMARDLLGDRDANWKASQTNKGVRITRTR